MNHQLRLAIVFIGSLGLVRPGLALGADADCHLATLLPEKPLRKDFFGLSVSASGARIVVGRPGDDAVIDGGGSVYVYQWVRGVPVLEAKLFVEDADLYSALGYALDVDRDRIVAGAYGDDDNGLSAGAAYVFDRLDGRWQQSAKLLASDGTEYDEFGRGLALDGDRAAIGAPRYYDGFHGGAIYVFERQTSGAWLETAKLLVGDRGGGKYGQYVALRGDLILAGAPERGDQGNWSGAAFVFERQADGTWRETAKLLASDGKGRYRFGSAVAIGPDELFVGASGADGRRKFTGAVYRFVRDGLGWREAEKLLAEDDWNSHWFGQSLALDGDLLLVGDNANCTDGSGQGAAYVFARQSDRTWRQAGKLVYDQAKRSDYFGYSVGLSGPLAVVGATEQNYEQIGYACLFAAGPDADGDGRMDACRCAGDLDRNWLVDAHDLAILLNDWGCTGGNCPGDADDDGDTDLSDLATLLAHFGQTCP